MRTSNRLLLIFFIGSLSFFVIVALALREKYNKGEILDLPDPEGEIVTYHPARLPSSLSLSGNLNVRIMPSDTFSLQWERREGIHIDFRESGDSLIIVEDTGYARDPNNRRQSFNYLPWVIVHCGPLQRLQLSGVLALLRGTRSPGGFRVGLDIYNTQLCLGDNPDDRRNHPPLFYDSVQVQAVNSSLQLFRNTMARKLDIQLDDRSEIHDFGAQLDSPVLRCADSAQIHLTGRTLRRIETNIPPN